MAFLPSLDASQLKSRLLSLVKSDSIGIVLISCLLEYCVDVFPSRFNR